MIALVSAHTTDGGSGDGRGQQKDAGAGAGEEDEHVDSGGGKKWGKCGAAKDNERVPGYAIRLEALWPDVHAGILLAHPGLEEEKEEKKGASVWCIQALE
mmetsp:Transcript_29988/g.56702  ORF Transcript_29988/g.56702 Transcript_29988/m.56702 type:complete len:100 (-) Transcript_29988:893-1192(-)